MSEVVVFPLHPFHSMPVVFYTFVSSDFYKIRDTQTGYKGVVTLPFGYVRMSIYIPSQNLRKSILLNF